MSNRNNKLSASPSHHASRSKKHNHTFFKLVPLAVTLMTVGAPVARAADISWMGSNWAGDWETASNWIGNVVPDATDRVYIDEYDSITLTINAKVNGLHQANSAALGGSGTLITTVLNWTGGLQYGTDTTIATTVTGNATLGSGTSYEYQSLSSRTLNLNGTTIFQSYLLSQGDSVINNNGTFISKPFKTFDEYDVRINSIHNFYDSDSTFNNAGTFIQDAPDQATHITVAFNNTGSVEVNSGTLVLDNLSNYNRTTQTLSGGSYHIEDGNTLAINLGNSTNRIRTNSAAITLNGTNANLLNSQGESNALSTLATNTVAGSLTLLNGAGLSTGAFANAGAVVVGNGSSFASSGNYVQTAGSTVVHGGLTAGLVDIQGGSLTGNGIITGNVTNAGLVGPGASPGTLNVLGDFTQLADGVLAIEIAGTDQGITYDWLNISGNASLAGTLDVFFTAGYLPTAGNAYTILSYGNWDQTTFDAIQVTGLDLTQYTYSTHP